MKTLLSALLLLFIITTTTTAQDPTFSQFNFNKLYLNPAFAGHNGGTSFNINSFAHTKGFVSADSYLRTSSFSVDHQFPCQNWGIGLIVLEDKEGLPDMIVESTIGGFEPQTLANPILQTISVGLTGAYYFHDNILEGFLIGASIKYASVGLDNMDNAIFSSQLDHVQGIISTTPLTTIPLDRKNYLDSDLGFVYTIPSVNNQSNTHTFALNFSHLGVTNPDASLQNRGVRKPIKYTAYYGGVIKIKRIGLSICPQIIFNKQQQLENITFGLNVPLQKVDKKHTIYDGFYLGLFYQNTWYPNWEDANSFILNFGFSGVSMGNSKSKFSIGYSFEIPNRGLNTGLSHEISLRYNIPPKTGDCCPWGNGTSAIQSNPFIQ